MKIKKNTLQNRRDFYADYECENCGHVDKNKSGYDDGYFHNEVIPNMKCEKCGKGKSDNYIPKATKYPDGFQI